MEEDSLDTGRHDSSDLSTLQINVAGDGLYFMK